MSAREFLRSLRRADELINRKLLQLEELRTTAESITMTLTQDVVQTSRNTSREDLLVKIIDLDYEINSAIDKYADDKREAMRIIDTLEDDRLISILYRRYLERQPWEQIAVEMSYTYRRVTQLHGMALQELDKIIS